MALTAHQREDLLVGMAGIALILAFFAVPIVVKIVMG